MSASRAAASEPILHGFAALPAAPLGRGALAGEFAAQGVRDFRQAARLVHELPYGRNADRADWRLVLRERRGTCSTKHALLAALAAEASLPVELSLGLYLMSERNTPGVGALLRSRGLHELPEAHCYLVCEGRRVDVTRSGVAPAEEPVFLREQRIAPEQIGEYKLAWHRRGLREWVESREPPLPLDWEQVWELREACIRALAQPPPGAW